MLNCRHCDESFTSKISFRIHQQRHLEEARRNGAIIGERAPADDTFDHDDIEIFNQNVNPRKKKGNSSNNKKTEAEETNEIIDATSETTINAVKILMSETKDERGKRGKYFKYSPELREQIAEYAQ